MNEDLLLRLPSELVPLEIPFFANLGISLWIKREDLVHPKWGGNKYRKLKYNLLAFQKGDFETLVTFGGLHSNHIYATAAICNELDIRCIGIIRGEEAIESPTITFARSLGMQISYVSRAMYKNPQACIELLKLDETHYIVPEGGTNELAVKGTEEVAKEVYEQLGRWPKAIICPFGTGGTAAGILNGMNGNSELMIFPALKGNWISPAFSNLLPNNLLSNFQILTDYHFGGYGKFSQVLIDFISEFYEQTNIPLDPLYTGKMVYGFLDWAKKNPPEGGSEFVIIHTGGIQGNLGFNQRFKTALPVPDYILR